MPLSIIEAQREILLHTIRQITGSEWKVLVLDVESQKVVDNVLDRDTILNESITNIEIITDRRATNRDVEAIYLLTPQPHIVDCVMADLDRRKYRKAHLVWTSLLHPQLRERMERNREQIALFRVLNVEFFPRESHLVTFRDPWSFPVLFHPALNHLVKQHMADLAQKIVGVCVSLGEYPTIRYYRPRSPTHEAAVLCSHLARYVQDELDLYAKFHQDFPPPTSRPRAALYILDRSIDLFAPVLHEFTYQAMAHDLLPIKDGDRVTYRTLVNEGQPDQQEKDVEISEKDKIWVENRHRHMKDCIEKLMADFQKFIRDNPNFTKTEDATSLHAIKDMLAGLPQFQELKEAYALHLSMAQESMNRFQKFKLPDLASVEQILATGLDEEYKKPKGLADQVIRMLDEPDVLPPDRLRLLMLFLLFKDGLVPGDLDRLLAHAQLPPHNAEILSNLEILGARKSRNLKDSRPAPLPLFARKPPPPVANMEEYALSRFEPTLQHLLESHATGTLDTTVFPYTKPPLDEIPSDQLRPSAQSLRTTSTSATGKPTWARTRTNVPAENLQRVVVFMAGGATYSESRVCYEVGRRTGRDVVLVTSHMLTPGLWVRQLGDLSVDKRRLGIPAEMPRPQAPRHLFESDERPLQQHEQHHQQQQQQQRTPIEQVQQPPTQGMGRLDLGSGRGGAGLTTVPAATSGGGGGSSSGTGGKLTKDHQTNKEEKVKKKHHFGFGKSRGDK